MQEITFLDWNFGPNDNINSNDMVEHELQSKDRPVIEKMILLWHHRWRPDGP